MSFFDKEVRIAERKERRLIAKDKKINNMNEKLDSEFHKFVNFNGTILIRRDNSNGRFYDYYCYNGEWGIQAYLDKDNWGGSPYPVSRRNEHFKKNVKLIKATEEQWVKCVGEYRPKNIKLEGGYVMPDGVYLPDDKTIEWGLSLSNPCSEISLGESQPCILPYPEENKNELMYLLIRC